MSTLFHTEALKAHSLQHREARGGNITLSDCPMAHSSTQRRHYVNYGKIPILSKWGAFL